MNKAIIKITYPNEALRYKYIVKASTRGMLLHEVERILNGEELATSVRILIEYETKEA